MLCGPHGNLAINFILGRFSASSCGKLLSARPRRISQHLTEILPLFVGSNRDHHPLVIAFTWVASMWGHGEMTVVSLSLHTTVDGVIKQCFSIHRQQTFY